MIGNWEGTLRSEYYDPSDGNYYYWESPLTFEVTNQEGNFFWGSYTDEWGICEFVGTLTAQNTVKINDCWKAWGGTFVDGTLKLSGQHLTDIGMSKWSGVKK